MKKSLIALAVLAASGAAMAQSSVTLYGRLDASIGQKTTEKTGVGAVAKLRQTAVDHSNLNTTFWGLKGTEDLGGGLTANFKMEAGFALDTGASTGTMFEREANVGLTGGFGTVTLGRQYPAYDSFYGATNNMYNSNLATTGDVWKTGVAPYVSRVNNGIGYVSPVFGGFSGALTIGLGEDKTATDSASRNTSVYLKYAAGPLVVGIAHQVDKTVAVADDVKNTLVAGSYDFGVAKLNAGYNLADKGTMEDKEYQVGVSVPFGAAAVALGYSNSSSEAPGNNNDGSGYSLVGTYNLSKRTTLYAGFESTKVETANGATTTKASTTAAGVRHLF
ncbi:porin [Rhodoferax sp.]|uniref:porin n=1 Tax=Rhodoferax sp. TaxID=50421 RepID=UPI00271D6918|nr:porin [Rhodoferax sp.]MDO9144589.1 porin [Rhodoferax sp.]